ncbi:SRPBCC family protein [Ornithinimicrobium cerasi]|uniref:SRPBCC family protein n=1 Tax=Ornithinimicrobium cerasi TaxID=2248773 RepID=UPI000EFDE132|nr:SRPBCC family protein [Ornithinimicrobium cerasi]
MKDLLEELTSVERTVRDGEVPAGPAKVVLLTRTYPAAADDVWDALTDRDRLARWFLPVSGDLEVGGRFQVEGNAGGVVRECEAPRRLVVTWEMGPAGPADTSLVEVRLTEDGASTRLELEHRAQVPPEMWDEFGPGAVGVGWDGALLGLALHLAGQELGMSPEEVAAHPAVREFNTRAARAWGEAQLAAGDDAARVEANVAATTGFYVPPAEG